MNRRKLLLTTAKGAFLTAFGAITGARAQTPIDSRSSLPIPQAKPQSIPALDARDARAPTIRPLRAPQGAPNIVIVLLDDMGFGGSSAYGGPCNMPVCERLAKDGLTYTRFHTTALCSPTRQALLTGRNHHSVNMGGITEIATGFPGYTSVRPDSAATIAEILKLNGYNTAAFGKMHQTPVWETSASGPFDRWPVGDGFERFYGFLGGETNQWQPTLFEGTTPVATPDDPNYHFSEDLTTKTIDYMREQKAMTPDKPFFVYLSYGATHAPHHVPREWIEKYRGKFDAGWDKLREQTFPKQKQLGVIPQDCQLTERPKEIPAWDTLSADDKRVASRLMEAFAGFAEHTDMQVGRVVDALQDMGALENTLFLYMLGDNGASAEGGLDGAYNEIAALNGVPEKAADILPHLDEIGGPMAYNHFNVGWAHATNCPYQWTKQVASHWGGTRNGMIVHWPSGIKAKGELRHQWCHVIDIVPTLLEATKLTAPEFVNGIQQQPIEGASIAYSFDDAKAAERHTTQYFEMFANRGIYHQGWSAVTRHSVPWVMVATLPKFADDVWELYAPDDWSQAKNIAAQNPEKLKELQQIFLLEGAKYNVFPLDDRRAERLNSDIAGRPEFLAGRTSQTLFSGMSHMNENTVLNIKNKSHAVTAEITVRDNKASGAVIVQGGRFGGWCLYLKGGVPAHCYNYLGFEHIYARGAQALAPGKHTIRYEFTYDGGGVGKGGMGALLVDGQKVGEARLERTVPFLFSGDDFADIGKDYGAPVTEDYETPHGGFTGGISWVRIDIGKDVFSDPAGLEEALAGRS
ncbi:arylsulfatase [Rhizobiales bacterium GAS113]|nr:arylsulfatase [Rhizobiales bacterium GAS113]